MSQDKFTSEVAVTVELLTSTKEAVEQTLTDPRTIQLKIRVVENLNQQINFLSTRAGLPGVQENKKSKAEPITKMFGKDVSKSAKQEPAATPVKIDTPDEVAAKELKLKVDQLYPEFANIETDAILDTYAEIEIRGVAKRAGLPVTETHPSKIDADFVNQVKEAIRKKAELEAGANPLTEEQKFELEFELEELTEKLKTVAPEDKPAIDARIKEINEKLGQ
jgi:hypothetical protein